MDKLDTDAIEEAYKSNFGTLFDELFGAYQGAGLKDTAARKAADDRFANGLKILRDVKASATKLAGP